MVKKLFTKRSSTLLRAHLSACCRTAQAGGRVGASATILSFLSAPPPKKSAGGFPAGGQKGRELGGRNFCPSVSVPVPFEQEKSGRGFGWNSAFLLPNQNEASPATCLNTWKTEHHRKILFLLREEKIRRVQNGKSKEYFSVVWRAERAVAEQSILKKLLLVRLAGIEPTTPALGRRRSIH